MDCCFEADLEEVATADVFLRFELRLVVASSSAVLLEELDEEDEDEDEDADAAAEAESSASGTLRFRLRERDCDCSSSV